jgi:hypothetical protein
VGGTRALGECECEWVARVPWESVGAGWKTKSAIARWKVECARTVGECGCMPRAGLENLGAWRVRGVRV